MSTWYPKCCVFLPLIGVMFVAIFVPDRNVEELCLEICHIIKSGCWMNTFAEPSVKHFIDSQHLHLHQHCSELIIAQIGYERHIKAWTE